MRDFSKFSKKNNVENMPRKEIVNGKMTTVYYEEKEEGILGLFNSIDDEPDETMELLDLLSEVRTNLKDLYSMPIWVKGEISGWKKSGQHIYFDLIQRNNSGTEDAKISAKLWASNVDRITKKFKKDTNQELKNGIKCEWEITLDYHPKFGLSVIVQDVKSIWTIGEHEKKVLKIKEQLISEDLFDLQKQRLSPDIITKLAIVAPSGAAGLGDFKSEADIWEKTNLINIEYQFAIFEGEKTKESVSKAIQYFSKKQKESIKDTGESRYDLLIILRGGGSKASLAWLDEYDIAKEICLFNGPVWSAIGHEQDSGVLDEISNKSIHTPSKAAKNIWDLLNNEFQLIKTATESIKKEAKYKLSLMEKNIDNLNDVINKKSQYKMNNIELRIDTMINLIKTLVNAKNNNFNNSIDNLTKRLIGVSPNETLKRGYAIVSDENGQTIKSKDHIVNNQNIKIKWFDSELVIKNIKKED